MPPSFVAALPRRGLALLTTALLTFAVTGCSSDSESGAVPDTNTGSDTGDAAMIDAGDAMDTHTDVALSDTAEADVEDTSTPDSLSDVSLSDVGGADGEGPDATADTGPDVSEQCPSAEPLQSLSIAMYDETDDLNIDAAGKGLVTKAEPYCCDADWTWEIQVDLDAGGYVNLRMRLPTEAAPPAAVGEPVYIAAGANLDTFSPTTSVVLTDIDGSLRYLHYNGVSAAGSNALPCTDGMPCATFLQVSPECPAVAGSCGDDVYPPVALTFPPAPPVVLRQADVLTDGDVTFALAESRVTDGIQCLDYPGRWVHLAAWAPGTSCDPKLTLSAANPEAFELYALCTSAPDGAKVVAPELTCPGGAAFVDCAEGETACLGSLEKEAGAQTLTPAQFARLCQLSHLPEVSTIVGGHYL